MGLVLQLSSKIDSGAIQGSLDAAPLVHDLREAAREVIRAVHGLPDVMNADLGQIEVYLGRAGAAPKYVKSRWLMRYEKFKCAPSAVALVVFRAPTSYVRGYKWERAGQLLIGSLKNSKALCCANALTGDSGRWPDTVETAIYLVARLRKGPKGYGVDRTALNAAVSNLIHEEDLDAEVIRVASQQILRPDEGTEHVLYNDDDDDDDGEEELDEVAHCKAEGCVSQPYPGNRGYCRRHRVYLRVGELPCKVCGRAALPGNYGFCGRHR